VTAEPIGKCRVAGLTIVGHLIMARLTRRRAPTLPLLVGIVTGSIVTVLVLATSPAPGIQWPPAAQVEFMGTTFTPRGVAGGGVSALAPDCTTMLVDVDSSVPTNVWAAPLGTPINFNATQFPAPFYYWSGPIPVGHISVVVTVSDPSAGISLTLLDASFNLSGPAHFGFAFSASDCP
jgi:hypothetical protein